MLRYKQSSGTSEGPDQNAASGLVLHCLLMSHKKDARLKGINSTHYLAMTMIDHSRSSHW